MREAAEFNKKSMRMYESAMTNNLNLDFTPTVGSANAEILTSLYIARGRSRTLAKDEPTMRGALRVLKNNVVGDDPFRLEMKVGSFSADGKTFKLDTETNRKIQAAWEEAGKKKNCTVKKDMSRMEVYQLVEAAALRDGSVLARHKTMFKGNKFGYALQLIESDRLQESYMGKSKEGNPIRFSIERDPVYEYPIAYWILTRHPGDVFGYNGPTPNTWRERVPAEEIIHFNNLRDRAEQDIGFPEMDAIIKNLHQKRQFDDSHVSAAIWSACKPFWITQEYPTGMQYVGDPSVQFNQLPQPGGAGYGTAGGTGGDSSKSKFVSPATGEILQYGQKPMLIDPKFPVESATGFTKDKLRAIGIGAGLAYHAVSNDFEGLSFSAARAAEIPQRDYFKVRQAHFITDFIEEHFNKWLECAIMSGALDLPMSRLEEYQAAAVFHGKRWPYVQPVQDAQADIMLIEANLKSRSEVLADMEGGRKFEEVMADKQEEDSIAESHGQDLHQDVTLATIKKGEPGETQPPPDGNEPTEKRYDPDQPRDEDGKWTSGFISNKDGSFSSEEHSIVKETDKALLLNVKGSEAWIPKSQIKIDGKKITMPGWIAEKFKPSHETFSPEFPVTETEKAYKLKISVNRVDGEPDTHTVFLPKSQVSYDKEKNVMKAPSWLMDAKDSQAAQDYPSPGFSHLMW